MQRKANFPTTIDAEEINFHGKVMVSGTRTVRVTPCSLLCSSPLIKTSAQILTYSWFHATRSKTWAKAAQMAWKVVSLYNRVSSHSILLMRDYRPSGATARNKEGQQRPFHLIIKRNITVLPSGKTSLLLVVSSPGNILLISDLSFVAVACYLFDIYGQCF